MKFIAYLLFLLPLTHGGLAQSDQYLSPSQIVYSPSEPCLYVVQSTAGRVDAVEPQSGSILRSIDCGGTPGGIALSEDGRQLYITAQADRGKVLFYDLKEAKVTATVEAGHWPNSPLLSPDEKVLYACSRFDNRVLMIDTAEAAVIESIPVPREPVAAALTADGRFLLVANHLPAGAADTHYSAAAISVIDTAARQQIKTIALPNGSTALRGICLSPDGRWAYATHILARYQLPTTQVDRGWMNTNALSVIDVRDQSHLATFLVDDVDRGAANPWAVACSPEGARLYVTHAGTHELSVIDRPALHRKLEALAAGQSVSAIAGRLEDVPRDLSFLVDLRQRIPLDGQGPRTLAVAGDRVYVGQYFSDSITAVDLSANPYKIKPAIALNPASTETAARRGEALFNDASICFQNWQSCASCHPDGRADGLNWDLLNDGIGNPKNTKSILLSHQTPPAMITGIRDKAETAVRSGLRYILFAQRPEADAAAIDAYLQSLKPVPSPFLQNGQLSPSAQRGKQLFETANCHRCHSGPQHTNLKKYEVGTGVGREKAMEFDTPALAEVWRTAPYLYAGQAADMKAVLTTHNPDDRHGSISAMSDDEIGDLIEYILSL